MKEGGSATGFGKKEKRKQELFFKKNKKKPSSVKLLSSGYQIGCDDPSCH
jgi:hypothetical protein